MKYDVININDILQLKGRSFTEKSLKRFSCPKNPDVEAFVKSKAISFAKKYLAVTYLVVGTDETLSTESSLTTASPFTVGYFTLTHKPWAKPIVATDAETEEILSSFSYDVDGSITKVMSPFLIAQFAKNDALPDDVKAEFSGSKLMEFALEKVQHIQDEVGGRTVHLECEDVPALKKFYEGQGFRLVGERTTNRQVKMLQYLKVLTA